MSVYTAAVGGNLVYRSPTVNVTTTSTPMAECSGIGVSRTYNQVVWCHDDSGDTPARFFAFNTANGLIKKIYNMVNPSGGAAWSNSDFEELSLFQRPTPGTDLIFIYDTIGSATTSGRLYRMVEPDPNVGVQTQTINANQITISFPSGVYSEANFVDPLDGHFVVFHTSTNADITVWRSTTSVVTAANQTTVSMVQIANLGKFAPIPPVISGHTCEWLGSADIAPDRSCILLHPTSGNSPHYDRILIYNIANPLTTTIADALATTPVLGSNDGTGRDVVTEVQGEATAFLPSSNGYMRLGEGANRPMHIVDDRTPATPAPAPIVSLVPDGRTFNLEGTNLFTRGNEQYAVWARRDHGLMIGKRSRSGQTWTTHQFTGVAATELGLPMMQDDHCYAVVAVDGLGRIHVAANMSRVNPVRMIETVNADGNIAGPWNKPYTNLPGATIHTGVTYPQFVRFSDGTLMFMLRNSGSLAIGGDNEVWRRGPTATVWTHVAKLHKGKDFTPAYNGATNLGPYTNVMYVDPSDRLHVSWGWRVTDIPSGPGSEQFYAPSYVYSDDKGTTWKAANGTTITPPIQINNNLACRCNADPNWPYDNNTSMLNGGGTTADPATQYPMFTLAQQGNPFHTFFWWNGTVWQSEDLVPGSVANTGVSNLVWFKGEMWVVCNDPNTNGSGRCSLYEYNGTRAIRLGGTIPRGNPNPEWTDGGANFPGRASWSWDTPALNDLGAFEVLIPEGDNPKVFTIGRNALTRI